MIVNTLNDMINRNSKNKHLDIKIVVTTAKGSSLVQMGSSAI